MGQRLYEYIVLRIDRRECIKEAKNIIAKEKLLPMDVQTAIVCAIDKQTGYKADVGYLIHNFDKISNKIFLKEIKTYQKYLVGRAATEFLENVMSNIQPESFFTIKVKLTDNKRKQWAKE